MRKLAMSVVIPTKDHGNKIVRCLDSIFKQTHLPEEIIIIDSSEKKHLHSTMRARDDGQRWHFVP